jgi:predicted DNA-binding transcriptional regulator AlpA
MNTELKIDDVARAISKPKSAVYKMIKSGEFPEATGKLEKEKGKPNYWDINVVLNWIEEKMSPQKDAEVKVGQPEEIVSGARDPRGAYDPYAPWL